MADKKVHFRYVLEDSVEALCRYIPGAVTSAKWSNVTCTDCFNRKPKEGT